MQEDAAFGSSLRGVSNEFGIIASSIFPTSDDPDLRQVQSRLWGARRLPQDQVHSESHASLGQTSRFQTEIRPSLLVRH